MLPQSVTNTVARAEQLFRAGRLDEMEGLCRSLLEESPQGADAALGEVHRFLALSAYTRGQFAEAVAQVQKALVLLPHEAAAHDNLSLFLAALGKPVDAEAAARQAVALMPGLANGWHNLGRALLMQKRFADAEPALREAIVLSPNNADVWNNLAAVLEQRRREPEAVVALQRALQLRPDFPLARQNLTRLQTVRPPSVRPASAPPRSSLLPASCAADENNLGAQLLAQGRFGVAEAAFRRALALEPDLVEPTFNLGKVLLLRQKFDEAEPLFHKVLQKRPNWAEAHYHLGLLYGGKKRLTDAEVSYRRALELEPKHMPALNNLGAGVLNNQGRIAEARAVYQQALALAPDNASCHSNMLLNEQYAPGITLASLAAVHAEWQRKFEEPLRSSWRPIAPRTDVNGVLRLGFVSGDFILHPVGLFLAPVLQRLDPAKFFTVCYASQEQNDEQTRRLSKSAGLWRWVWEMCDEALAEQIRSDDIDLLIDLAGHTGRNRLQTFARRPAPVQLTWMGYVGTTGLHAIDYLIADRFEVPAAAEHHFTEKVLRLPDDYVCYEPPAYAPAVGPLPALAAGHITFGSFNNTAKVNPELVAVWAEVLRRVPGSRLLLKYHWLSDAGLCKRLTEQFAGEGIPADRLELQGSSKHTHQLDQYNRVDIGLDTFPYGGGLTTLEASWMGVPVITSPGDTFASRHSLSHLSNAGLTETITQTQSEYVELAVQLANDLPRLAELRATRRPRMAASPVCDLDRFAANFADLLTRIPRTASAG
jgi:predicted O-linked N-acetylglucosamine transferase (SPINDLY family)